MNEPIIDITDAIDGTSFIGITALRDGDEVFDVLGRSLGPVRLVKTLTDGTLRYKIDGEAEFRYLDPARANGTTPSDERRTRSHRRLVRLRRRPRRQLRTLRPPETRGARSRRRPSRSRSGPVDRVLPVWRMGRVVWC